MITRGGVIQWGLLVGLFSATVAGACGPNTGTDDHFDTEGDACTECQAILVECTSTATNEAQFVECRDQWLQCQRGKGIAFLGCANPGDEDACSLCRERFTGCKEDGDALKCEAEFSVCKAFLMTRGDVARQCSETEAPPAEDVACGVCQRDFAGCKSDTSGGTTPEQCDNAFGTCKAANELSDACSAPSGQAGCDICIALEADCSAAGSGDCAEDFEACTSAVASGVTCEVPSGGTGGAGGMSGEGGSGAGGGPVGCLHNECEYGDALEASCSACAAAVCAVDSFCCDPVEGKWDYYCLDETAFHPECGC